VNNFERAPDLRCNFGAWRYFAAPHKSVAIGVMADTEQAAPMDPVL
jgi:hypothetical protein